MRPWILVCHHLPFSPAITTSSPIKQLCWASREDWNLWMMYMHLTVPTYAMAFNCSQVSKSTLGTVTHNGLPSNSIYKRSLGFYLQYLFSELSAESQLYITFNTGLRRFILQPWHVQTAKLGPESYLRPLSLKHVSAEMALALASGDFWLWGEDTGVAVGCSEVRR